MTRYDPATLPEVLATHGPTPYAVALLDVLRRRTTGNPARRPAGDGIYNRRRVRGSATAWSLHAVGRAVDLGVRPDAAGHQLGQFLVVALMAKADALGIQQIIFTDGTQDVVHRPGRPPKRQGPRRQLHRDHLHIEVNRQVAKTPTVDAVRWIEGVLG